MTPHPDPAGRDGRRDYAALTDRQLVQAHVAGDSDAFGALFHRHKDRLWAVAMRTLGDPEAASDALQDAMVSAFRRAATYRGDAAVTTWLHRVVVNACLDRVRRAAVRAADPLPEDDRSSDISDHQDAIAARQTQLDVEAALAMLPAEQRAALVLVDMHGYPVADVAEMLGVAPGTVKSRCSRARAKLAPLLQQYAPVAFDAAEPRGNRSPAPRVTPEAGKEHSPPAADAQQQAGSAVPPAPAVPAVPTIDPIIDPAIDNDQHTPPDRPATESTPKHRNHGGSA